MKPRPLKISCTHVFLFILIFYTFPTFHFILYFGKHTHSAAGIFFSFDLNKNESPIFIQMKEFPNIGVGISYEHTEYNEMNKVRI